jgi:hypothetical protein
MGWDMVGHRRHVSVGSSRASQNIMGLGGHKPGVCAISRRYNGMARSDESWTSIPKIELGHRMTRPGDQWVSGTRGTNENAGMNGRAKQ